jgi:hypothetical protein
MKESDIHLNKKEKKDVLTIRSKIKKTNNKFVKLMKKPPIDKINKLINLENQLKENKKSKKKVKAKKELKKKENKIIPELFVKLETENVESYRLRKEFIENNLPKTPEEYKIIISLSIVLVNKIFYKVKYSEHIEKVLKEKLNNLQLKNRLKRNYFLEL